MADFSRKRIVHLLTPDKFTVPFVEMVNREFRSDDHLFLFTSDPGPAVRNNAFNVVSLRNPYRRFFFTNTLLFRNCVSNSDKIILHGNPLLFYLVLFPWLLSRTYWVIYGYEIDDNLIKIRRSFIDKFMRRFVFKRVYGHITHIEGDSEFVNRHFNSGAAFFYSPIYRSNVVTVTKKPSAGKGSIRPTVKILVGNNTSPTNNHESIFKMLLPCRETDIMIYCPLSYGSYDDYRDSVIKLGREYFGDRFIPMTEFMKTDDYIKFLGDIDIAVFNHQRQEGMGVIIQLLSLGKTVYMNPETTSYKSFIKRGFKVFDNSLISHDGLLSERDVSGNKALTASYYSYEKLVQSWDTIFRHKS